VRQPERNLDFLFGIVTPTRRRHRFLRQVLRQVRDQSYPRRIFVLVSDGPDARAKALFERHADSAPGLLYRETPRPAADWGYTPRCLGLQELAAQPTPPDYVVFWDDDNAFYPHALAVVAEQLRHHGHPDLLLLPVHAQLGQIPRADFDPGRATGGTVDTANFVISLPLALRLVPHDALAGRRGFDARLFDRIRAEGTNRIVFSSAAPIGRYDGLRPLATLRWRLGIPPANLADQRWYEPIRRWLRS